MGSRDDDDRPDPDALLERVQAEDVEARRTKLKVWLGASPGVGKTYTMLENAQRLRREGVDVVAGIVETHGRKETEALLGGIAVLPRKRIAYRGRTLDELDLDAALARKPAVLLVDELAHTNAPGSRHHKRWQDALELLEAGIEVHTTLNVQHVESLNDVVAQITHVRVRETVPDKIVERADEIELVDVAPEVVRARLREGKVYVPAQAERAAEGFFKEGNLHALREIALRLTAERVDVEVQAWRRQQGIHAAWPVGDRIMVCVGPSPTSARLIRSARRMSAVLRAPWIAAYVEAPQSRPSSAGDRARLAENLRLAESLGGEVVSLIAEKPADALLGLARERNVTRMLVGKPSHSRWRDLVYGSLLDDLVRGSGDIDVHVIAGDPTGTARPSPTPEERARSLSVTGYGTSVTVIALAGGIAALMRERADLADIAMVFLVAIAVVAARSGLGPSILASVLAVATFDFFFVPPYGTFAVTDLRHVLTFAVMLLSGFLIARLTERIRRQSEAARTRERRTASLYALTRALAGARDAKAIATVASDHLHGVFESRAALFVADPSVPEGIASPAPRDIDLTDADRTVARWALERAQWAGRGTDTLPGARVLAVPLLAEGRSVGVLAVLPVPDDRFRDPDQRHLLETFVSQIALSLERAQLAEEAQRAQLRAQTEEMRSSLLSSVSHDLRTPIASIAGAATTLLDASPLPEHERTDLMATIRDEAERLERLVRNLLEMTRVESGALEVKREWVPLEEIVGAVMTRSEPRLVGREIVLDVPADLQAPMDPVLIEQVLLNLLENAARHTPPGTPIEIHARCSPGGVTLEVADRGSGIPPGSETKIFEKFVRAGAGAGGVGLGLAICRGIAQAHGGTMTASSREGGGASFQLTLPVDGTPPSVPIETDPASEARA